MYKILVSEEFIKDFKIILPLRPSLEKKIYQLKHFLQEFGFSQQLFQSYDLASLGNGYWRCKFIPYRIIIRIDGNTIYLEKIFKRKGKSDYKDFH